MTIVPRTCFMSVAAASLALVSSLAPAQAAPAEIRAGAAVQGQNQSAAASDQRVCARVELSNTRVARRVCRTRAEWERMGGLPTAD
jgi:hypothetical protein